MALLDLESCDNICALPEDCIANALSLTSPKDACRLSAVDSTFRSVTQSDAVWNRFLPSDYRDLISRAVGGPESLLSKFSCKRDLYLHLCDHPILIDGGRKSFSLEKCSGKKCYMIAAQDLTIVWSDTPHYWRWISLPESRFPKVAELLDVCWFEITTKISTRMLSPGTCYVAYLVYIRNSGASGFDHHPAEAFVKLRGHEGERRNVFLDPNGKRHVAVPRSLIFGSVRHRLPRLVRQRSWEVAVEDDQGDIEYPKARGDGWLEVVLGEHLVGEEDGDLEMGVMEVRGSWKNGYIFQGIEIRPKRQ